MCDPQKGEADQLVAPARKARCRCDCVAHVRRRVLSVRRGESDVPDQLLHVRALSQASGGIGGGGEESEPGVVVWPCGGAMCVLRHSQAVGTRRRSGLRSRCVCPRAVGSSPASLD